MKNLIFSIVILLPLTGCAGLKTGCAHITGSEITIPYVGGKANGNAYGCYMTSLGWGSPKVNSTDMATVMTKYLDVAAKDNTIKTVDGGIITYNPPSK